MKIALARHHLVPHRRTAFVDAAGFSAWCAWYDAACAPVLPDTPSTDWDLCWTSDLPRAKRTAECLHDAVACETPLLREVPFGVVASGGTLPLMVWQGLARIAWWSGHASQPETRRQTRARAAAVADVVLGDDRLAHRPDARVLIVAHGLFMHVLATELRRRGFRGGLPLRPAGGVPYELVRP
ncbi:MAG: hypothetical protein DMD35_10385 [Gemmatimonadetes bacterium]|nr:MAG: hypothetical protein DMD35_10385 [Gemmatimonadota bacterium]